MSFNFSFSTDKQKAEDESTEPKLPSWKHRRRLIYFSYFLGVVMIIFAMFTFSSDTQVASQLIVGGVSLITIILTAYTAFATLDDRWHFREYERNFSYGASNEFADEELSDDPPSDGRPSSSKN